MASKRENKRKGIKSKKKGREAAIAAAAAKGPAAGQGATTGGGVGEGSDTAGVVRNGRGGEGWFDFVLGYARVVLGLGALSAPTVADGLAGDDFGHNLIALSHRVVS